MSSSYKTGLDEAVCEYREMETISSIFAVNFLVFQKQNLKKGFLWT
jgi:hypothetical protein